MTTAREEAEKNYPDFPDDYPHALPEYSESDLREAFALGAKWQSEQPVEVTDGMIEDWRK